MKRIRPATLEPVDYTHEMYTRSLWFAEGVTNTYGSYTMVRTGIWDKQQFYQDLSVQISDLEARPAEQWQSAEESSLDAWLEKYALYIQPQRSVSYYTKGQVLGVLLDIIIRDRTDNQRSLDDVMREMNVDFAKGGRFYPDSLDIRLSAEKVAGSSLNDFFVNYVSGADHLPYEQVLGLGGLELRTGENVRPALGIVLERSRADRSSFGKLPRIFQLQKHRCVRGTSTFAGIMGNRPDAQSVGRLRRKPVTRSPSTSVIQAAKRRRYRRSPRRGAREIFPGGGSPPRFRTREAHT